MAHAQNFAYDQAKSDEYTDENGKVISLSKFVNVAEKEVTVQLDNFAINKLWYMPAMAVKCGNMYEKDVNGEYKYDHRGSKIPVERPVRYIPEQWFAFSIKAKKKIEVTYDYLKANFMKSFLDEVKEAGIKKSIRYIQIPPGRSQAQRDILLDELKGPALKFYQRRVNGHVWWFLLPICFIIVTLGNMPTLCIIKGKYLKITNLFGRTSMHFWTN